MHASEACAVGLADVAPQAATFYCLQVVPLIVEGVAVDVAHLQTRAGLAQFSVHKNGLGLFTTYRDATHSAPSGVAPPLFAQKFIVGIIDHGELVLAQRYEFHSSLFSDHHYRWIILQRVTFPAHAVRAHVARPITALSPVGPVLDNVLIALRDEPAQGLDSL